MENQTQILESTFSKVDSKETAQNVDKSPNEKAEIVPDKISQVAGFLMKKPTPKPNKTQTPKMKNTLNTKLLLEGFRDNNAILALKRELHEIAKDLQEPLYMMEVCGGHTHTLMRYGLSHLLPESIQCIHGPGCPVCIMPKSRINQAYTIAMQKDVILLTLGDMMRVPGSLGSLQDARALGADVRFVYSPMQALEIAKANPHKRVVYFAIGFETTTPMTAAVLKRAIESGLKNLFIHSNHVLVPPPLYAILGSKDCKINALIAPSHVSVIAGSKIYEPLFERFAMPIVVSGFEPVDMMESIVMIARQAVRNAPKLEVQYRRVVTREGNTKAQELMRTYFAIRESFEWRGLGHIAGSALRLRDEFSAFCAEREFASVLDHTPIADNKACRCGDILRGVAKPLDCKVFGKSCTPEHPLGSCMVSSEGACAAYYKYGQVL